ncbi:MAG: hypothetical protein ACRELA_19300 [Candidatus Rokuibacteriota bacterium]
MRRAIPIAACFLACAVAADAGMMRMVVADVPYAHVWDAAQRALADYPIERAMEGLIVTGWRERRPRADEAFQRMTERLTVRVEPFADRITRITVEVEARGWRDDGWVAVQGTETTAREVLARIRAARG